MFPDLFLDQDKLPPILTQLLEAENEEDGDVGSPMSDASFWDFNHDEGRITQANDSDDESSAGSSGYESMILTCFRFTSLTNYPLQPMKAIPLTRKTLGPMYPRKHLLQRSPSCSSQRRHQARGQARPNLSLEATDPQAVRSHRCGESSSIRSQMQPSPSLTGLQRQ